MNSRHPRKRFEAHLEFIRGLPSIVPGAGPVEAAHIRYADSMFGKRITGMGEKPSDCWVLPLAHDVHMAQHAAGNERLWWGLHDINPLVIAALLFAHSGDEDACKQIIANARSIGVK